MFGFLVEHLLIADNACCAAVRLPICRECFTFDAALSRPFARDRVRASCAALNDEGDWRV